MADGITEDLIRALQSAPGLQVVSRAGAAAVRGLDVSPDSLARALRVGILVTGVVSREADSIRISVRTLDDAGIEMDRATLRRRATDVVSLSEALAEQVASLIRKRVGTSVRFAELRTGTRNAEAWLRYQRAVQSRDRGDSLFGARAAEGGLAAYAMADSIAAVAEALDPNWAEPRVLRGAIAYSRARRALADTALFLRSLDAANAHAQRALTLSPQNANALALRGDVKYFRWLINMEGDTNRQRRRSALAAAQSDMETAVRLNPALAATYASLSHLYNNVPGKTNDDVRVAATMAMETDAFLANADVVIGRIALAAYDDGQHAEADRWCREGRRRYPRNPRFVRCQLYNLAMPAAVPTAQAAWALADSLEQETIGAAERRSVREFAPVLVAAALARAGLRDSARAVLTRVNGALILPGTGSYEMFSTLAWIMIGDHAAAISHLRAHLVRNPGAPLSGWWFAPLADDPQFKALIRDRAKLPP